MKHGLWLLLVIAVLGCQGRESVVPPAAQMKGTLETPEQLAAAADIPLYPGATLPEGKSNIKTVGKETRYEIIMSTPDSPLKVETFYRKQLNVNKIPDTGSLMGYSKTGGLLQIDIEKEGAATSITVVSLIEKS